MTVRSVTSRFPASPGRQAIVPAVLGAWSALFALAPDLEAKLLVTALPLVAGIVWWTLIRPERWLALFFFCALLLPPLPFAAGNSGIHVAPLAALLGLIVGALHCAEWRAPQGAGAGSLSLLFTLFLTVLAASVGFAAVYSGWDIALGSLARVLLFGIAIYVFLYTYAGPYDAADAVAFARFLFWIGLAGAAFACIDFWFQFPAPAGYGAQFVWLDRTVLRRAQGVFYEASTLGNFCAFFLLMIRVAAVPPKGHRRERLLPRPLLAAGTLVFSAALIFSSSRASLVAVIVAAGVFLWLRRVPVRRVAIATSASLGVVAIAMRFALPAFSAKYWSRLALSAEYLWSSPNGVLSGRITHWKALEAFLLQNPWHILFGIGYKTLPYTTYLGAPLVADNTWLSLLVETGILGIVVFALLNLAILRTAWRAAHSHGSTSFFGTSFFGTWIFCFWCGELVQMLSGDLITYWRVLPVYFWVLAVAARGIRN